MGISSIEQVNLANRTIARYCSAVVLFRFTPTRFPHRSSIDRIFFDGNEKIAVGVFLRSIATYTIGTPASQPRATDAVSAIANWSSPLPTVLTATVEP